MGLCQDPIPPQDEGEEDDMEEEDELDLESGYDDEAEVPSDYIHVDMPWEWRECSTIY